MNLLDYMAQYPHAPGAKVGGTSRAAAEAMKPRAATLRDRVYTLLKGANLTADEAAILLKETVLATRPRVTELKRMGLIEDTGIQRKNASGIKATVWRARNG